MIPIISALLYLAGGQVNKWFRWGMGIPIAGIAFYQHHSLWVLLAIPAYFIATNAFPYGEKSWLNFLGEYGKFFVVGFVMGLCSLSLLPLGLALLQGVLSGLSFVILKILDDRNILKNPWQELCRGFIGTVLMFHN